MKTLSLSVLTFLLLLTVSPVHAGDEWILGALRKEFNPQIAAANQKIALLEQENLVLRKQIEELNLRITRLEAFLPRPAADKKR